MKDMKEGTKVTLFGKGAYAVDASANITFYREREYDYSDRGGRYLGNVSLYHVYLQYALDDVYVVKVSGADTLYIPEEKRWMFYSLDVANKMFESVVAYMNRRAEEYVENNGLYIPDQELPF